MKKSLIAVGVVGVMGLTSVAMAAEFNWYGSVRGGIVSSDAGGADDDSVLDIGATGSGGNQGGLGVYTRIGVKASTDLGNGQTAGAQVELGIDDPFDTDLGAAVGTRLNNVWVNGSWGQLTLGQQGNPYRSAANWDQSWMLGGNVRHNDGGSRLEGIKYSSNLGGPFSFDLTVLGDDSKGAGKNGIDRLITTAHYNFGVATVNVGYNKNYADSVAEVSAVAATTKDVITTKGTVTATTTVFVPAKDKVGAANSYDNVVISVNGSAGAFGYYLGYEKSTGNAYAGTSKDTEDTSITGLFLSYQLTASDKIYLEYAKANTKSVSDNVKDTLLGYSHSLGEGVTFIAEHSTVDPEGKTEKSKVLNLILKVDF